MNVCIIESTFMDGWHEIDLLININAQDMHSFQGFI
jgi:hypothetical protein